MNKGKQFLSELVHYRTYAKYIEKENRRETRNETIERNIQMHVDKFPKLEDKIREAYIQVIEGRAIPSMRAFQFGGEAIVRRQNRMYNCCFVNIASFKNIADLFFQSMSGSGVGYSVKARHVKQLPKIKEGVVTSPFVIEDSAEGWANSIIVLLENPDVQFDYTKIRLMGTPLSTGGTASGPKALIHMHAQVRQILRKAIGRQLTSFEVHRICCHISDAVVCGGVRRCLPEGSKVHAKRGMINIEDIQVGEEVLTSNGYFPVTNKFEQGRQSLVTIATQDSSFDCTPNHKIAVLISEDSYEWKRADELEAGDRIISPSFSIDGTETNLPDFSYDKPLHSATCKDIEIPQLDADMAWLLGLIQGDGYVSLEKGEEEISIPIENSQEIIGQKAKKQLERFGVKVSETINENYYVLRVKSKQLAQYFHSWLKQPKTKLEIPSFIWKSKQDIKLAYISGIMDASGCCKTKPIQVVCTIYESFARDIQKLISSCGLQSRVKKISTSNLNENWQHKYEVVLINNITKYAAWIKDYPNHINKSWSLTENKLIPVTVLEVQNQGACAQTWDIEVSEKHEFFCNGYLMHNSATIALFDPEDTEMLNCKSGSWWEKYPELARANNSAVVNKNDPDANEKAKFIIEACFAGGQAEPGLSWTNDDDMGFNPCHEISLCSSGVCNLSEINAAQCFTKENWLKAVEAATIIGTLQASYTDFKYVDPQWKKNAENDALLGISITGQAENQAILTEENLREGAELAVKINVEWAKKIGINPAKRITTTKPSGSASSWLGTTAGIHAGHEVRYLRRVRIDKDSKLAKSLQRYFPAFVVQDPFRDTDCIMQIPIKMNDNVLLRKNESSIQLLERMKKIYNNWIVPGHIEGPNTHNVSLTVSYLEHEKEAIKDWMIKNKNSYYGISLIPYDGGDYQYLPYSQPVHPEVFDILQKSFNEIAEHYDFKNIKEIKDMTDFTAEPACSGGACVVD